MDENTTKISTKSELSGIIFILLIGIALSVTALILIFKQKVETQDYIETQASYISRIKFIDEDGEDIYVLQYKYLVKNKEYILYTDYATDIEPEIGSQIKIKYNPLNPEEAISSDYNARHVMLILGLLIILMCLFFLADSSLMISFLHLVLGSMFYYAMGAPSNNWSLPNILISTYFFGLVPILFIIIGILGVISAIFNVNIVVIEKSNKN